MQITVNAKDLISAITWASRAIGKIYSVPIMAGIRLEITAGKLEAGAFDYDMTARAFAYGETSGAGVMLVNGAQLLAAVKTLPKGTVRKPSMVTLTATRPEPAEVPALPDGVQHDYSAVTDDTYSHLVTGSCSCGAWQSSGAVRDYVARSGHGSHVTRDAPEFAAIVAARAKAEQYMPGTLTMESGTVCTSLLDMPLDEYPAFPEVPALAGTSDGATFARSFTRVAAAAGKDVTLPVLTCVALETGDGDVSLAATDRYRLAIDRVPWTAATTDVAPELVLLPAAPVVQFLKASAGAGKIALHYTAERAGFAALVTDERQLIIQTSGAEFPRWQQLLPSDFSTFTASVTADAATLAAAVTRAGKVGSRNSRTVLDVVDGSVTVRATSDGEQVSAETVPATLAGEPTETGYNAGYLASMLAGVTGMAEIGIRAGKPAFIRPADRSDAFRGLVMPIRNGSER